jgi:riboflavin synthase alpha subunit
MFAENLDVFLGDFGVPCTAGGQSFLGLLDQPGEVMGLGQTEAVSIAYVLTVKTSAATAANLRSGSSVTANGVAYTVRERLPEDDGAFTRFTLRK